MRGERGVSLVELVIAMAILAIGLMGIISAITGAMAANANAKEAQTALAALQDKLATLKSLGYDPEAASNQLFTETGTWTVPTEYQDTLGVATGNVTFLTEAQGATALGSGALDLDNDGTTGESEAPTKFFMFIVCRVDVTWQTKVGPRTLEIVGIIYPDD